MDVITLSIEDARPLLPQGLRCSANGTTVPPMVPETQGSKRYPQFKEPGPVGAGLEPLVERQASLQRTNRSPPGLLLAGPGGPLLARETCKWTPPNSAPTPETKARPFAR